QQKPWPPIVTDARPPGPEPVAPRGHAPQGKTSSQDCSSDLLLRRNGLRQSRGGSAGAGESSSARSPPHSPMPSSTPPASRLRRVPLTPEQLKPALSVSKV